MGEFTNKISIVTGGATGIGAATVKKFADKGTKVYVLDINPLPYTLNNVEFINCDVTNYDDIKRAVKSIVIKSKRIDYLFSNAGIHFVGDIENTSLEILDKVISTNIRGTFLTLKEILPIMRAQQSGSVVLMGSDQSFIGKANSAIYGATKGAIGQLTKSSAIDYAKYGIRVNCVCPGTIDTPLYHNAVKSFSEKTGISKEEIYHSLAIAQPTPRIGLPEEVADLVLFLSSEKASFITGSLYSIDGGYTCGADRVHT